MPCMHPLICCTVPRENQSSKAEATSSGEQFISEATGDPKPNDKIRDMASKLNNIKESDLKKMKSPADDGLLVQCTPSEKGEKVECGQGLPLAVWCCKVAFMLEHECTLAFCMPCKEKSYCHQ